MGKTKIEVALRAAFDPIYLDVVDESHKHAGHAGMPADLSEGTHFKVEIVAKVFEGKSLIERHRMVYAVTAPFKHIHALSIQAKIP